MLYTWLQMPHNWQTVQKLEPDSSLQPKSMRAKI